MDIALNRSDLILNVAERHKEISEVMAEEVVKVMIEQMIGALSSGKRIEIRGFGSFALHVREPRVARNPKTGASVKVETKVVPHFKPGKALRDTVNEQAK